MKPKQKPMAVTWPPGHPVTGPRRKWFERFASLPPGLTVKEAATRLKMPPLGTRRWGNVFSYPFRYVKKWSRPRTARTDWLDAVDWSLTDIAIGTMHGKSVICVADHRIRLRKLPVRPTRGKEFCEFLKTLDKNFPLDVAVFNTWAKEYRLNPGSVRAYVRRAGLKISTAHVKGVPKWTHLNFDLPNRVLAEIWKTDSFNVSSARYRHGKRAKWNLSRASEADPRYQAAVVKEKERAARD